MDDLSIFDFTTSVHRVLLVPNLLAGIGAVPAILILVITIILMNLISIWCAAAGILLFISGKMICKNDPYALTVIFDRLMVPDIWRAD